MLDMALENGGIICPRRPGRHEEASLSSQAGRPETPRPDLRRSSANRCTLTAPAMLRCRGWRRSHVRDVIALLMLEVDL